MTRIVSFAKSGLDMGALHRAMLDAFSDYVLPMQPDRDTFRSTLTSRGFDSEASFVAVNDTDSEIIGFWNVAERKSRRYLIGSGTGINARGRGVSSNLGRAAITAATTAGSESFWLEVIKGNAKAEGLYNKLGFKVTRTLDCYRLDHAFPDPTSCVTADFSTVAHRIQQYATWEPTWQNSTETISGAQLTCLLHDKGGAIVGNGGVVHQIAAADTSALAEILAACAKAGALTLVNVDAVDSALGSLLTELGADCFISQSEMRLSL